MSEEVFIRAMWKPLASKIRRTRPAEEKVETLPPAQVRVCNLESSDSCHMAGLRSGENPSKNHASTPRSSRSRKSSIPVVTSPMNTESSIFPSPKKRRCQPGTAGGYWSHNVSKRGKDVLQGLAICSKSLCFSGCFSKLTNRSRVERPRSLRNSVAVTRKFNPAPKPNSTTVNTGLRRIRSPSFPGSKKTRRLSSGPPMGK